MESSSAPLALDARALDGLRRRAGSDPQSAARAAAGQFEAVFMRQMLKSMRDAVPRSGMWDGAAQGTYSDMLDQQLAQSLSGKPGGLADVIARQLTRQLGAARSMADAVGPQRGDADIGMATGDAFDQLGANAAGARAPIPPSVPSTVARAAVSQSLMAAPSAGGGAERLPAASGQMVLREALAAFNAAAASPARTAERVEGERHGAGQVAAAAERPAIGQGPASAARWTERAAVVRSPAEPDLRHLSGPQADFVRKVWPHALLAERSTGVPAAFIVGQAALETGWGRHEIRNADGSASFNLFGIKATGGWKGASAAASTTEFVGGQATRRVERFRAYGSYAEAFQDWATLMARSPRYAGVIQSGGSVEAFAAGMQRAGYATDPAYGAKLEKTIQRTLALQRLVT
jgi:flagellar protein FlgJ